MFSLFSAAVDPPHGKPTTHEHAVRPNHQIPSDQERSASGIRNIGGHHARNARIEDERNGTPEQDPEHSQQIRRNAHSNVDHGPRSGPANQRGAHIERSLCPKGIGQSNVR